MTNIPGPPSYPPYGTPPYGAGPARSSSNSTVVTALLAVLFVVATALAAWGVHAHGTKSAAGGPGGAPQPGQGGIPAGASASYGASYTPSNVPSYSPSYTPSNVPSYTPTYSPTTPYSPPSPTRQPLDPQLVNRTFQVFMNGLVNRSLSQVKSVTCPRLKNKTVGTALRKKYISRWKGQRYRIYNSLDYVIVPVTVRYVDPRTGGDGATAVYRWYVNRYPNGEYLVCGYL